MDEMIKLKIDILKSLFGIESPIKLTLQQIYFIGEIYILTPVRYNNYSFQT